MPSNELKFEERKVSGWSVPVAVYGGAVRSVRVLGTPILRNERTRASGALLEWQRKIAAEVKAGRGRIRWSEHQQHAVSLSLRLDGGRGDLDNYSKPILDAVAGGLFCSNETDPLTITDWRDFDDYNFRTILLHRLSDVSWQKPEGVAIYVSRRSE